MKQFSIRIALIALVLALTVLGTLPTAAAPKMSGEVTIRTQSTTVHCMTADRIDNGYTSGMVVSDDPNMPTLPASCDVPFDTSKIVNITLTPADGGSQVALTCANGFIPNKPADACHVAQ